MNRLRTYIVTWIRQNTALAAFISYWAIVFLVYLPAAEAGRVGDFPGWVEALTSNSFADYVNRKGSGIASMYQFTQIVSYLFYKIFGANAWQWHLLYVTLQATNALLLFIFFGQFFERSEVRYSMSAAFAGGMLFCVSPHISEVVVWEPSFHYLLGLMLMMMVMVCAQRFLETGKSKYAFLGGVVFFCSTFCLEVFYLTPLFVVMLGVYYKTVFKTVTPIVRKFFLCFTLPQSLLFLLHFLLLRIIYHQTVAHIGTIAQQPIPVMLAKSLKYIFHILFYGRFYNDALRIKIYQLCESGPVLYSFYGVFIVIIIGVLARFSKMKIRWKPLIFLLMMVVLSLGLILPLWLPDTGIVIYDRYTYVLDAFVYMLAALLFANMFNRYIFLAAIMFLALANYRFTHKVVAYWQQSADVVNNLVTTFPNDPAKKVLLLNLPECFDGVQMVGTRDDGEFRMMYNSIMPQKITNDVYDVEAFYMRSMKDGAHVTVLNDSTIKVTLNQWGTWWIYYGYGATSYENKDFKVDMRDQGHWYNVILKHPSSEYLLLYTVGREWKKVDLTKQNIDQY